MGQPLVWIGDRWWAVVGILEPLPLAPEIDRSALVGWTRLAKYLGTEASPTTIYVRAADELLDDVRSVLPATSNPESPEAVLVSRPSDAIEARAAAATAFTTLFLGLGAVALLVGGLGIANVMLMAVLERRNEIGLRRALGATRGHIVGQFLAEAILLAGAGGVAGAVLGSAVAAAYATSQAWVVALPIAGCLAGVLGAAAVGAIAGLYPAVRAATWPRRIRCGRDGLGQFAAGLQAVRRRFVERAKPANEGGVDRCLVRWASHAPTPGRGPWSRVDGFA